MGNPSPAGPTCSSSDLVEAARFRAESGGVSPRLVVGPGELEDALDDGLGLSPLTYPPGASVGRDDGGGYPRGEHYTFRGLAVATYFCAPERNG